MKISRFEEACQNKGLDPVTCLPDVSVMPERYRAQVTAQAKIAIIADASRKDDPDWNDGSRKWFPWFDMEVDKNNPTGFRFCDADCGDRALSSVGSWLSYESEEDAEYHGKTHIALYRDMMVIPK